MVVWTYKRGCKSWIHELGCRLGIRMERGEASENLEGAKSRFRGRLPVFRRPASDPSIDAARRRGALEIDRTVRRQVLHGRLDVARRRDPGHFDEAKP